MYDLVVIGGGPGGYVCAIKAAQNGLKVACVDAKKFLGGTCLNEGCIPSKALLESSHHYYNAKNHFSEHGISVDPKIDIKKVLERKNGIISALASGIDMLFKKNKIEKISGYASFVSKNEIDVKNADSITRIQAKNFVIATGSEVLTLGNVEIDGKIIISSTEALSLEKIPEKMTVIGGGVIGLELGCVWSRFGADVTIIEYGENIIPSFDKDISTSARKILEKQALKFITSAKVLDVQIKNNTAKTTYIEFEKENSIESDIVLFAIGRKPFTKNLGLEKIGAKLDPKGFIQVDKNFKITDNIYAIGDVIPGPMLAHKAEDEGVLVADIIAGSKWNHINYDLIPSVVYTNPEISSIGLNEIQLNAKNIQYNIGKFNFIANSRARTTSETDGFVKILACKKTDRILGCSIIGKDAGNLIHELAVLMEFSGSAEDLAMICHAHPTLNEAIKEAALAVSKKSIHS